MAITAITAITVFILDAISKSSIRSHKSYFLPSDTRWAEPIFTGMPLSVQ